MDWAEEDQRLGNVISVPPEVYKQGCVCDVDDGLAVSIFSKVVRYFLSQCESLEANQVQFHVSPPGRELRELVIQLLSRPPREEVEKVSGK